MTDHVAGRHVGEDRRGDAALTVLLRGDDCRRGGPALADDVDLELDGSRADHHRAREHRVRRTHRLLRKPLGRGHDHLRQHLGALDDLSRRPRLPDRSRR